MSKIRLTLAASAVSLLAACGGGGTSPSGPAFDAAAVGATLDAALTSEQIDGYSFALVDAGGTLDLRNGGDIALGQTVELASASKLPTVLAILTLVDDGLLDLDRPVGQYLSEHDPGFVWPVDKAAITMRMLMAHTAGMVGLSDSQPDCLFVERQTTLRACAQVIADSALIAAPGSVFNYGGADLQVAAHVATTLAGGSWHSFFADRIGRPLGLTRLSYGDPAVITNPRVAGGAVSTARDYGRLLRLLLNDGVHNGTRVLSSAMVAELLRDQIAGLPVQYAPFAPERLADFPGYGLGVFISAPSLHPGSAGPEYSDPGLFGATPWLDLSLGYGAVLLIENTTATGLSLWDQLRPSILAGLASPPPT